MVSAKSLVTPAGQTFALITVFYLPASSPTSKAAGLEVRGWLQPPQLLASLLLAPSGDSCLCNKFLGALLSQLPRPQKSNREQLRQRWKWVLGREEREREGEMKRGRDRQRDKETEREEKDPTLDTPQPSLK